MEEKRDDPITPPTSPPIPDTRNQAVANAFCNGFTRALEMLRAARPQIVSLGEEQRSKLQQVIDVLEDESHEPLTRLSYYERGAEYGWDTATIVLAQNAPNVEQLRTLLDKEYPPNDEPRIIRPNSGTFSGTVS